MDTNHALEAEQSASTDAGAVRKWRQDKGMTLETLAAELGISPGTLSRLERGEIERPGRNVITKLTRLSDGLLQYEDIVPE